MVYSSILPAGPGHGRDADEPGRDLVVHEPDGRLDVPDVGLQRVGPDGRLELRGRVAPDLFADRAGLNVKTSPLRSPPIQRVQRAVEVGRLDVLLVAADRPGGRVGEVVRRQQPFLVGHAEGDAVDSTRSAVGSGSSSEAAAQPLQWPAQATPAKRTSARSHSTVLGFGRPSAST